MTSATRGGQDIPVQSRDSKGLPKGLRPDRTPTPAATHTALIVRPAEACQMLRCSVPRLYELINAGELDSFLDGRARKITTESIHRFIARKLAGGAPPPAAA